MQSEQFDKKIKDAADRHHPAYDEMAWTRMEKLLDKHLPQKGDRKKRVLFFWLLFLLLGGLGAGVLIYRPWENKNKLASVPSSSSENNTNTTSQKNNPVTASNNNSPSVEPSNPAAATVNTDQSIANIADSKTSANVATNTIPQNGNRIWDKDQKKQDRFVADISSGTIRSTRNNQQNRPGKFIPPKNQSADQPVPEVIVETQPVFSAIDQPASKETNNPVASTPLKQSTPELVTVAPKENVGEKTIEPAKEAIAKNNETPVTPVAEKKQNKKGKKSNSLFFGISTGPDLSFVGSGNSSKVKIITGAGVGFTFKDRWTLRSGFYTGRKVYSAKPSDYNAPPEFYTYYPYLQNVDANCKVYEIPVALSYNFGKKSNMFVSAGLSTLLMKEETYTYTYKYTQTGNSYNTTRTLKNKNAHYFSVGTLSFGYKLPVSKRITLIAEPYVKVPFTGIGYGRVKLNSGGVLFTAGIRLF